MQIEIGKEAAGFLAGKRRHRVWKRLVSVLACMVVFCTTYALILPAITMESTLYCGKMEHTHNEKCYAQVTTQGKSMPTCSLESLGVHQHTDRCLDENGEFCCGYADYIIHQHEASCYDQDGNLWCTLPEVELHVHGESCYIQVEAEHTYTDKSYTEGENGNNCPLSTGEMEESAQEVIEESEEESVQEAIEESEEESAQEPIEPLLICGKKEELLHEHTANCFDENGVLICGMRQLLVHTHNEDCFQRSEEGIDSGILICELEEHTHTLACQSNTEADVETIEGWERSFSDVELTGVWAEDILTIARTQIGYMESTANFEVAQDGINRKGYSRYGAWFGKPYSDWDALFVAFCLNYAGVGADIIPYRESCAEFMEEMDILGLYVDTEYTPISGDLVFYDQDGDLMADHMGLVEEVVVNENEAWLVTIEGDIDNCVQSQTYQLNDESILGYGRLPEQLPESDFDVMSISLFRGNVFGEPSVTPGHQKKIDALRDGVENPDTKIDSSVNLSNLYRLYLDVTPDEKPTDLILVLDNSSSMFLRWNSGSDTRNDVMNKALKEFIPEFLNSHEGNRIYLSYYSGEPYEYSSKLKDDQNGYGAAEDAWVRYTWGTAKDKDILDWIMSYNKKNRYEDPYDIYTGTGCNYAAGFAQVEEALRTVNPEHDVKLIFLSSSAPSYFIMDNGRRGGNGLTLERFNNNDKAKKNEERCKEATLKTIQNFQEKYPNLVMSAVGFGGGITEGGNAEEVLKAIPRNGGSYIHVNDSEMLLTSLNDIIQVRMSNVVISDTLSQYAEVYSDQPDYKVVMNISGKETILWSGSESTEEGQTILESVGLGEDGCTVSAVFRPEYELQSGATYTLSYNIQSTEVAYQTYLESRYADMGDSDTDYGENQTSTYNMGFHSNDTASVSYKVDEGEVHTEDYAHPVIQVIGSQGDIPSEGEVTLFHTKRIDAFRDGMDNPDTMVDDDNIDKTDLYRLYLDIHPKELDKPTDLVLVLDNSGSMFSNSDIDRKKRNTAMNNVLTNFIPEFLGAFEGNRISIVYFSGPHDSYPNADAYVEHNTNGDVADDAWIAYEWGDNSGDAIRNLQTRCKNSPSTNNAGTNYVAGFRKVEEVLTNADPTHNVKLVFLSDGIPTHYIREGDIRGGNGLSTEGSTTDLFWYYKGVINEELCKQPTLDAISEFKRNHPDLYMSAIAFSPNIDGTHGRDYALRAIPQNGGILSYVKAEGDLRDSLLEKKTITNLKISDTLSQYVELYTRPDYKVIMRKAGGKEIVLYQNGEVTKAGTGIVAGVEYDETSQTVSAVFEPGYVLEQDCTYELSYNVKTSQTAYKEFAVSGYGDSGDAGTDYDSNQTSSGQPGFYSNENAQVEYKFDNKTRKEMYDHPVVQAVTCTVAVKKTDRRDPTKILPGAEFALYREAYEGETGVEVEGLTGKYIKISDHKTSEDGIFVIDNLIPDDYWLVETKAPDQYQKLKEPVHFKLTRSTDGKGQIVGSDMVIDVNGEELPGLEIANMPWDHELPNTGGSGTDPYIIGGLLIIAAGILLLYKKKAERRTSDSSNA